MSDAERIRKAIILGLVDLDRRWFKDLFGTDPIDAFPRELALLVELGLCTTGPEQIRLTRRGRKYRDLIVQIFFSRPVRNRLESFDYCE